MESENAIPFPVTRLPCWACGWGHYKIHYWSRKESGLKYWFVLFTKNSFCLKIQAIRKDFPIPRRNDAIQITGSQRTTCVRAVPRHDDLWRNVGLGRLED